MRGGEENDGKDDVGYGLNDRRIKGHRDVWGMTGRICA